jgi:dipeptidyl aminopeptidase/acylaminoacyl peptidase
MKTFHILFTGLLLFSITSCAKKSIPSVVTTAQSVDGQLVFCGREENSDRFDVYLVDLVQRNWRNLTEKYISQIDNSFGHSIGCDEDMHPYRVTGLEWSPRGDLIIIDVGGPYLSIPYILQVSEEGDVLKIVRQWPAQWSDANIFLYPKQYSWSPGGTKVAFVGMTASDGYSNLFVGDVSEWENSTSDTSVVQMTHEYRDFPGVIYTPSWSPNGEKVVVSLNGHASGVVIVSADSKQSIFISNDTSELIKSVKQPSPWNDFPGWKPSWFPDSKSIVFVGASTQGDRSTLFTVDQDGNNLKIIIPIGVSNPVVSPNGQSIAYIENAGRMELSTVGRIVRVDPEGLNRQVIATIQTKKVKGILDNYYIRDLSWSPDGKWLVFTSNFSGKFQLYLISADGSVFEQIMEFPGDAVFPQWRPFINQ